MADPIMLQPLSLVDRQPLGFWPADIGATVLAPGFRGYGWDLNAVDVLVKLSTTHHQTPFLSS